MRVPGLPKPWLRLGSIGDPFSGWEGSNASASEMLYIKETAVYNARFASPRSRGQSTPFDLGGSCLAGWGR